MKVVRFNKVKKLLFAGFAFVATALFAVLFTTAPVTTSAATIDGTNFRTDGASIRVFKKEVDGSLSDTDRKGIRFHIELNEGYEVGGIPLLDTSDTTSNVNGAYKMAEGYKTYTLVIPTRLLESENVLFENPLVKKIDTTGYWYSDGDNWESIAYLYDIPVERYTDAFSYCGVICSVAEDGTETALVYSDTKARSVAYVAKEAYVETIQDTPYWGSSEMDEKATPLIKAFVPEYNIIYTEYDANGVEKEIKTETVLWGDAPKNAPTGVSTWYDTKSNGEIDLTQAMEYSMSGDVKIVATSATEFVLTGVAKQDDFTVGGNTYNGVKIYATLHKTAFANQTEMDIHAVNVEHKRGGAVLTDGFALQGVWTMEDGNQMRLFFAFDSSNLQNGDEIVIKGDSVFYANGKMYELTEDYVIDCTMTGDTSAYDMNLGYIENADVQQIINCAEDSTVGDNDNGIDEIDEWTIRVYFYEDVLVDGAFTFMHPEVATPVYLKRGGTIIPIAGGLYHWVDGKYKILELIGDGEYKNAVYGQSGDELFFAAGTHLQQNGGYYLLKEDIKSRYNATIWATGDLLNSFGADALSTVGSKTDTVENDGSITKEIRIDTVTHWTANMPQEADRYKVSNWTAEKRDVNAPYAVYHTAVDGTVTEIEKLHYYGQSNGNGGYYQILVLRGFSGEKVGERVTIAAGTYLWIGGAYVEITEEITYYFNGAAWIKNFDPSMATPLTAASFNGDAYNNYGQNAIYLHLNGSSYFGTENDKDVMITAGSIKVNGVAYNKLMYHYFGETTVFFRILQGNNANSPVGVNELQDTVVIEKGTCLWLGTTCCEFTEDVEWIYGGQNDKWSPVLGGVDVSIAGLKNATIAGLGTFSVGNTYNLKVTPNNGYNVSKVVLNGRTAALTKNNEYTFTVAASNEIYIEAVKGNRVTFSIPSTVTIDGGAISNGMIKTVAAGDSLTFAVSVAEGYKVTNVSNAVNNGDGTYTVTPASDVTVTISTENRYKVIYSGANTNVTIAGLGTASDSYSAWVDNDTEITFTVEAASGYTLMGVKGATANNDGSYTVTVSGANVTIQATALETNSLTIADVMLGFENRTGWNPSANPDHYYFAMTYTGGTNKWLNVPAGNLTGYWNDHPEKADANCGVDIMEYIYINDSSLRDITLANKAGTTKYSGSTFPFDMGSWYAPVVVEPTTGSGLFIRVLNSFVNDLGGTFNITIKAGFSILDENSKRLYVNEDIAFTFNGSSFVRVETGTPIVDATSLIGMENRTGWNPSANPDHLYFAMLNSNGTNGWLNVPAGNLTGYWNDHPEKANDNKGVDIMEYIHINGTSLRDITLANKAGTTKYSGSTFPFDMGSWYAPVVVEPTTGSGLFIRILNKYVTDLGGTFTITIKAGFTILDENGNRLVVNSDINYNYNGSQLVRA